ncbi:protein of unknown function [Candidatus Nitrotoga arctica]|uniref:Uncharacterized protein n=1 Tax=Candidatus Nitrotoga arctica TaxID=453162 RepID=A0ABN8ANR4_9PROT|nr:protein of unknown function [Candidatus Nitrotoga arctica]
MVHFELRTYAILFRSPVSLNSGNGGINKAEIARTAGLKPKFYMARTFWRLSWSWVIQDVFDSRTNQLAGKIHRRLIALC